VPPLSEERRVDLVKSARTRGEETKVSIRNIRRHSKDHVKTALKDDHLPEDMGHECDDRIQKMTDDYIAKIDQLLDHKEAEIIEV